MINTLSLIGEKLNQANILWAVGGSLMLSQYGLEPNPGDIDILVAIQDAEKADIILEALGKKKQNESAGVYESKFFYQYRISGVDVDVMAGFAIRHSEGIFQYPFDQKSVTEIKLINDIPIPFSSLEDWFVLYEIMPARESKADAISAYLRRFGLHHRELLLRALEGNLPKEVQYSINNLLECGQQEKLSKDINVEKFLTDLMMRDEDNFFILQELRRIVMSVLPDTKERMMYGGIMFSSPEDWGGVFVYKNHVSFEFGQGNRMSDPQKCLEGSGKSRRHLKIKLLSDIKQINVRFFAAQAASLLQKP